MPALPLTLLRHSRTTNVGTFHAFARSQLGYYYGRPILKHYLRRLSATIAVSEPARDFIRHYFPSVDPVVVPNGIDVERFDADLAPIRHLRDGMVNVLFVGRLEKRKGLGDLIGGFAHAALIEPRLRLIIVGDGPLRGDVESMVSRRRLKNVVLAGYVPDQVLPRYHASSDIFCAPATGGESFGIVLLEAMAASLPVIATRIPGYMSVVSEGVDSLVVSPRSEVAMGEAMARLARDPALRRRFGEAGRSKAHGYAWSVVAQRVSDVYEFAMRASRTELAGVHL